MNKIPTALITGATSGIGHELAKLFAKENYQLVIVARDAEELEETAMELKVLSGKPVYPLAKDLFEQETAFEIYNEVKAINVAIDVLVNNAGQGYYGEFSETDLRRQLAIIQLNICSLVSLTHLYLQDFIEQGSGSILNVSSIASKAPGPWQAVYHATKAFVQSFSEAIRSEVKDQGITVTTLLPGVTDTDFFNKADMTESKAVQDEDKMADPATVAKDGFDALMRGEDMVVSGLSNKLTVGMAAVTPDSLLAEQMKSKQEPVNKTKE